MRKIKSILVVANRDDTDKPLLEKAVQLARRLGARLELFACDAEHAYIMRRAYDSTGIEQAWLNLFTDSWGDCEVQLDWDESTDDFDPQWLIEYQVYVNGVHDHSTSQRYTRTIVYGTKHGLNTFEVVAVDTAGNRSAPAEATADLLGCFP